MPQNLKALTSLRFIAAMWVVSYDYWHDLMAVTPRLVSKGYLGVELFFVLSGFILSHVYLQGFGTRSFRYADFLWARLARVYPVHLATLLGMGALIAGATLLGVQAGDKALVWSSLPAQLTLTQAWGLGLHGGWNHPSWSISAEWFAYLTFPVFAALAWALRRRPGLAVILALILVAVLEIGFERLAGFPLTRATIAWGALRIVPCFALGCAVHLLWSARPILRPSLAITSAAASLGAILLATQTGAPDAVAIALFGALIYSLAGLASAGTRLLTAAPLVYLGEVSFAVYMMCIPWQLVFEKAAHRILGLAEGPMPLALWLAMFAGVVPAAMILHHLVERPARDAMRRHGVPFQRNRTRLAARSAALVAGN
ncbi:acyltransferase family protein [Phenylobacterium aquaticum]|uniref:acyltransferase family protein n=1 Tax=Phenylobacterium aquaticum TaxID=1763816 RepID=UPI001F5DD83C|nr:acyltransferase [Phenylobacterium aquaticum]MCI3132796.1 acyltransferase [Phenylobacterium aquaticum]